MEAACQAAGKECKGGSVDNHLFSCNTPRLGKGIELVKECKLACVNRGFGKDDRCQVRP